MSSPATSGMVRIHAASLHAQLQCVNASLHAIARTTGLRVFVFIASDTVRASARPDSPAIAAFPPAAIAPAGRTGPTPVRAQGPPGPRIDGCYSLRLHRCGRSKTDELNIENIDTAFKWTS